MDQQSTLGASTYGMDINRAEKVFGQNLFSDDKFCSLLILFTPADLSKAANSPYWKRYIQNNTGSVVSRWIFFWSVLQCYTILQLH